MEELMSDYKINNIQLYNDGEFDEKGVYLWVLHVDKIPPHIGISVSGQYFSLKAKGKDENLPLDQLIQIIQRKEISVLVIHLDENISLEDVQTKYAQFEMTIPEEYTCLEPVRQVLNRPNASKLEWLIDELDGDASITGYTGINLPENFRGIPFYTEEDIHRHLQGLNDA